VRTPSPDPSSAQHDDLGVAARGHAAEAGRDVGDLERRDRLETSPGRLGEPAAGVGRIINASRTHAQVGARQVGRRGEAVVPAPDDDGVEVWPAPAAVAAVRAHDPTTTAPASASM
jgi:hypothetical protein